MSRREIEIGVLADLGEFAHHGLPVSRPHPGVHDQRRSTPDDDADVGHEIHALVRDYVDVFGHFDRFVFLHEGRRLRLIVPHRRRLLRVCGGGGG